MEKKIIGVHDGTSIKVGPLSVKQPLPAPGLDQWSPFLLLHHAGPQQFLPGGTQSRLSPHPHRGFEPVTFLFSGGLHHKDSLGNEGFLDAGDVQWMTAGSGILHSEGPSEKFVAEGGILELVQLWVNIPRDDKMTQPKYQDIKESAMPTVSSNGFTVRIVSGTYDGKTGPASTFTPILSAMVQADKGAKASFSIPPGYNSMLYVLNGCISDGASEIGPSQLGIFSQEGNVINIAALENTRALLLAGSPINEPVVSYGPFVMNYPGEIKQAILDYETGKMGILDN